MLYISLYIPFHILWLEVVLTFWWPSCAATTCSARTLAQVRPTLSCIPLAILRFSCVCTCCVRVTYIHTDASSVSDYCCQYYLWVCSAISLGGPLVVTIPVFTLECGIYPWMVLGCDCTSVYLRMWNLPWDVPLVVMVSQLPWSLGCHGVTSVIRVWDSPGIVPLK